MFEKESNPFRSEDYKSFIREQPCLITKMYGEIDPHHVRINCGMSQKPSDLFCVPINSQQHVPYVHSSTFPGWEALGIDINKEIMRLINKFMVEKTKKGNRKCR